MGARSIAFFYQAFQLASLLAHYCRWYCISLLFRLVGAAAAAEEEEEEEEEEDEDPLLTDSPRVASVDSEQNSANG